MGGGVGEWEKESQVKVVKDEVGESSGGANGIEKSQASCAKGNPKPAKVDDLAQCSGVVG